MILRTNNGSRSAGEGNGTLSVLPSEEEGSWDNENALCTLQ